MRGTCEPAIVWLLLLLQTLSLSAIQNITFIPCGVKSCNTKFEVCNNGVCDCKLGFGGFNCEEDLDECIQLDPKPCTFSGGYCVNHEASNNRYSCGCDTSKGHWRVGDSHDDHGPVSCIDVNECIEWGNPCHSQAICKNSAGTFNCTCREGFTGDGVKSCTPIPVETTNPPSCEDLNCNQKTSYCDETKDAPVCLCRPGYFQFFYGGKCIDINECSKSSMNNCHRNAECHNMDGSYYCVCMEGSVDVSNGANGTTCAASNECNEGTHNCTVSEICVNRNPPKTYDCAYAPSFSPTKFDDPLDVFSGVPSVDASLYPPLLIQSQDKPSSSVALTEPSFNLSTMVSMMPSYRKSEKTSSFPSLWPSSIPSDIQLTVSSIPSVEPSDAPSVLESSIPSEEPSSNPSSTNILLHSTKPSPSPWIFPKELSLFPTLDESSQVNSNPLQTAIPTELPIPPMIPLEMQLTTDDLGRETSYRLYDVINQRLIWRSAVLSSNTVVTEKILIDSQGCYFFLLHDLFVDGLCCTYGSGDFELLIHGTEIALYEFEDITDGGSFKIMAHTYIGEGCDGMPLLPSSLDSSCDGFCGSSQSRPTGCSCDCLMTEVDRSDNRLPAVNFGDCCPDFVAMCASAEVPKEINSSFTNKIFVNYMKRDTDATVPVITVFDRNNFLGKESCEPNSECNISLEFDANDVICDDILVNLEELTGAWIYPEDVIVSVNFNGTNVLYYEGNIFPGILGLDCTRLL